MVTYGKTAQDIIDHASGQVVLVKGTRLEFTSISLPPSRIVLTARAVVNGSVAYYNLLPADVVLADGKIGIVRLFAQSHGLPLLDVRYPFTFSPTDPLVGDGLSYAEDVVEFVFEDDIVVKIVSDRNSGAVTFELKHDSSC